MPEKIQFGSVCAALVLFLFPWVEIRCSGQPFVTQSGLQSVHGGVSLAGEMSVMADAPNPEGKADPAVFVGLALVALVGAFIVSLGNLRKGGELADGRAGALCALALGLVIVQLLVAFPIKADAKEAMATSGGDPTGELDAAMALTTKVVYLPAFYLALLAMAVPAAGCANSLIKRSRADASPG